MEIGGGITIGPGIRISPASLIRSALSAAGQTAYDNAVPGNFIRVSSTDYNNVRTTLSNTKTIGDNANAILFNGTSYTGTCAALNNPERSNVDPGYYIIGFVSRHGSTSSANFRFLTSPDANARGTYTQLANQVSVANTSGPSYYVRKDPTDASVSTIYVGIVSNTGSMLVSNTNWSNAAFSCQTSNISSYNTWTARSATQPVFQALLCGTKQW